MIASVNRVVLLGVISHHGITVKYAPSGTPCASFTLVLTELGTDGKPHQTWIACEVWGKRAAAASELEPGQVVLFEGKLVKHKKGEQWEVVVSGFELTPVDPRPGVGPDGARLVRAAVGPSAGEFSRSCAPSAFPPVRFCHEETRVLCSPAPSRLSPAPKEASHGPQSPHAGERRSASAAHVPLSPDSACQAAGHVGGGRALPERDGRLCPGGH